ncbi:MAG: hypothetical protein ACXW15_08585 [Acidimicrobiia bacterium]
MEQLSESRISLFFRRRHESRRVAEMASRFSKLEPTEAQVWDEASSRYYPGTLVKAAEELGKPVSEVTAADLLSYPHEDLPDGPPSELGGEVPGHLNGRPESETRRRAALVAARVDALLAEEQTSDRIARS